MSRGRAFPELLLGCVCHSLAHHCPEKEERPFRGGPAMVCKRDARDDDSR